MYNTKARLVINIYNPIKTKAFNMLKLMVVFALMTIECKTQEQKTEWGIVGNPLAHYAPCNNSDKVYVAFESGLPPGEENQYTLFVSENVPKHTRARLKFDSEASLTLVSKRLIPFPTLVTLSFIRPFSELPYLKLVIASGTVIEQL